MRNPVRSKKSGIYCIEHLDSDMKYIGSAVDLRKRLTQHINGKWSNIRLQNSINKYGKDRFKITILEVVKEKKNLIEREQFYIDKYDFRKLYNIAPKAGSQLGFKHSKASKTKQSIAKTGKKWTAIRKQAALTQRQPNKWVSVLQIDRYTGLVIREFSNITEASKATGASTGLISKVCKYKIGTAKDSIWRYSDDRKETPKKLFSSSYTNEKCVKQIDLKTKKILKMYRNIKDAAAYTNIIYQSISSCVRNERLSAGGYGWAEVTPEKYYDWENK